MGTPHVDVTIDGLDKIGVDVAGTPGSPLQVEVGGTGTAVDVGATVGGTTQPVGVALGGLVNAPLELGATLGGTVGATVGATVGGTNQPIGLQVGGVGAPIEVGAAIGGTQTPVGVNLSAEAALGGTQTPIGFDADLTARLKELAPLFFNFLWKEIPLVKVALPHRYKLGFKFFNVEFFSISFCGESELITDKNLCDHDSGGKHV